MPRRRSSHLGLGLALLITGLWSMAVLAGRAGGPVLLQVLSVALAGAGMMVVLDAVVAPRPPLGKRARRSRSNR